MLTNIKVREDYRVVSRSFHIALGISEYGTRKVIGLCFRIQRVSKAGVTFSEV